MATTTTRAKKRMDRLMRHLTAQPASQEQSPSGATSTPRRLDIRRELASAQRERVLNDYGYELGDDAIETVSYDANAVDKPRRKKQRLSASSSKRSQPGLLHEARVKLARACKLAHVLKVAGSHVNDDCASTSVPGHGFLFTPLGLRFDEVTPDKLVLSERCADLPKLHADLYSAAASENLTCHAVFSAFSEDCELISITKDGLLPLCQDALRVHGKVRRVDGTNLQLRASRANHRAVQCWLVKNRGAVCSGRTIEESVANLVYTIKACAFQVKALAAIGGDLARLDIPSDGEAVRAKAELQERCSDEDAASHLFRLVQESADDD